MLEQVVNSQARFALRLTSIAALIAVFLSGAVAALAAEEAAGEGNSASDWKHWEPGNQIDSTASLQRGAQAFMSYCSGCHSLKYLRYSRMAADLKIPPEQLDQYLISPGDKATDYIITAMPAADAEAWFGKTPPDLSLAARSRGADWIYQFLKTFYVDGKQATGVNNLRLPGTAMPHVLSELQGVSAAEFRTVSEGSGAEATTKAEFVKFQSAVPGRMNSVQYDAFVRDLVNFLDYASEPTQVKRRNLGVWVILFLLAFTAIAYLLKQEYWKDVK